MLYDIIIVGSGAAAVSAACGLDHLNTLILDVGNVCENPNLLVGNLYDLKKNDYQLSDKIIGKNFEGLHNITKQYLNPKLKAPLNRFITDDVHQLTVTNSTNFTPSYSFAKGGMANAWGAGAYRFLNFELKNFPIKYEDLKFYYDFLTQEVGINGTSDDLYAYLGDTTGLLNPPRFAKITSKLYKKYQKKKKIFTKMGFFIGHPRQAVLTDDLNKRCKLDFSNLEFYRPLISSIYNPVFTLDRLIQNKNLTYQSGFYVTSYNDCNNYVEVFARNLNTNTIERYTAKKVILAAGTINTAKIVLKSNNDYITKLPLQENAVSYIPLFDPFFVGQSIEREAALASLVMVYMPNNQEPILVSMYTLSGPLQSEYLMDFPFSARCNVLAAKYCAPAMKIAQVFYPGVESKNNWIKLDETEEVRINFENFVRGEFESKVIKMMRKIGFYSHISLCKMPNPGNSFHYACTLPMKNNPSRYQTDKDGRLFGTQNIYIADSSNFSSLPAKNLTFTIMANAMRIATNLREKYFSN